MVVVENENEQMQWMNTSNKQLTTIQDKLLH